MKTRSMYKAERMSLDRLPDPVLETILCLLPTKEAARTSILSREWRYKWTNIPKLELSHSMRCPSVAKQTSGIARTGRCKSCYDINQILLLRQGPIHELTLNMPHDEFLKVDRIILHLSRNHPVKKLTLNGWDSFSPRHKLPISVFSLRHLIDLSIRYIDLDHPPIFNGFGSLRSLYLRDADISTKTLLHLLSNCPSLKRLSLHIAEPEDTCTINQLFECLPLIEHLTTWSLVSRWPVLDSVPQELSTSLIHLKYFCFQEVNLGDSYVLAFLLLLIKCSPNLEKIKLETDDYNCKKESFVWEKYSDVRLECLNELEVRWFENSKPEMDFVKFILARSPKLRKVTISSVAEKKQKSKILKTLVKAPSVSPVVITVT